MASPVIKVTYHFRDADNPSIHVQVRHPDGFAYSDYRTVSPRENVGDIVRETLNGAEKARKVSLEAIQLPTGDPTRSDVDTYTHMEDSQ